MVKWLFQHNIKSIIRSPDLHRKVIINIIIGFFMLIASSYFLLLGFFLDRMISEDLVPGSDPVKVVNGYLLFYFGIEFVVRLSFQKIRLIAGRQYLFLNLNRKKIADFILFKSLGTFVNFFPLLVIIPFFFNGVLKSNGTINSLLWLSTFLIIMVFNTYFVNYLKVRFQKNSVQIIITVLCLFLLILCEEYKIISTTRLSSFVFDSVLNQPLLILIPLAMVVLIYKLSQSFLVNILYLEELGKRNKSKSYSKVFNIPDWFGFISNMINLDLKLIMRHKRTRYLFWLPLLFVFYGLLIYPSGEYNKDTLLGNYFLLIVGALITGFFILSFAILIFSLESRYFCFIITNKIDLLTYLRAKYYLMIALSLVLYLISLFYVFYGIKIIIINSVMLLFNSGFTSFLLMYLATFNKIKFDLNAGMNSWQGKGGNQFLAGFSLFLIVFLIFLPFGLLKNSTAGFIVFGIIGLLGLIFHNKILQMLIIQFTKRKYIMSEGFRQT